MRFALLLLLAASTVAAQSADKLQLRNVRAESVDYRGKRAVRLSEAPGAPAQECLAIVTGSQFHDGVIEVEVAGTPAAGSAEGARGFIGIAFRVQPEAAKFELIYLRPTNGRADDQLRRNHSTQYISFPDWPWQRTRKETPGLYESYVDLEPAVWTRMKIVVSGNKARLFVHGADQPCLIVNDLKLGDSQGGIALWIGPGTEGYFTNLSVSSSP